MEDSSEVSEDVWTEFTAIAGDTEHDEDLEDSVGPIKVEGDTYVYEGASEGSQLRVHVQHQKEKGLSFQIWPSSLTLARYAELMDGNSPGFWKGKHVLELGCGCGLVGLVFAALGAKVMLTDLPTVLDLLNSNVALNRDAIEAAGGEANVQALTWGSTSPTELSEGWQKPDLIVAADVIYHRELFQPLLQTLKELSVGTDEFLLAHVRRWKSDKHFFSKAKKIFEVSDITVAVDPNAAAGSHTSGAPRLFRLSSKRKSQS